MHVGISSTRYQQALTLFILCQNSKSVFCHMSVNIVNTHSFIKNRQNSEINKRSFCSYWKWYRDWVTGQRGQLFLVHVLIYSSCLFGEPAQQFKKIQFCRSVCAWNRWLGFFSLEIEKLGKGLDLPRGY